MSVRASLRATPALLRVGFAETLAYRAELFVWILATTMPLVMLALFHAVAREAPIGRYGQREVVAYFLATFIVRQLTGSWAAWQINMEVRQGTFAARLLRPVHPLWAYAVEGVAGVPVRAAIAVPVAAIALVVTSRSVLPRDPLLWGFFFVAAALGYWITFLVNACIGSLCLYTESSLKLVDVYLGLFFVFSGYLVPLDVFPPGLRAIAEVLPFRFQIALPVELLTSVHGRAAAAAMLLRQLGWALALLATAMVSFHRGLRRFAAYGG